MWIEGFGCEIAPEFIAHYVHLSGAEDTKHHQLPVWINLEYLSAEGYVARCHGLPSPVLHGPAQGWTKHFFYPGFTHGTGGLLREPDLVNRMQSEPRHEGLCVHCNKCMPTIYSRTRCVLVEPTATT